MARIIVFCSLLAIIIVNVPAINLTNDNTLHAGSLNKDIESLDLSNKNLSKIEDGAFTGMEHLESINLSHNQLEELKPRFMQDCRHLEALFASHNKIRVIKSNTFEITLHKIDLSHNEISEIEENSFPQMWWLTVDVSYNRLTNLRDYTFSRFFSNINRFNASNNQIKTIEENALRHAPYFDKLDLSHNELSDLKNRSLCGIDSLTDLYISHNRLTGEDLTLLAGCSKLEFLDISHNKINHLDKDFLKNSTLKRLDLSNNEILDLDLVALSGSSYLFFTVFLRNNNLKTLHGDVFHISTLDLSHNKIEIVETKSFSNRQLRELDLSNNEIVSIGTEVFNHEVEILRLQHNKIKSFSNWFLDYHSNVLLNSYLNASHNEIEQVETGAVNENNKISELDLSYNKISKIATNAFNSTILEYLHLEHNSLTVLEGDIFNCSALYLLNISYNKIKTIESGVFQDLNNLGHLDLSHNQIETYDFFETKRSNVFFWGSFWFKLHLEHNNKLNKENVESLLHDFLNRQYKPSFAINATLDQQSCQYFNTVNDKFDDVKSVHRSQAFSVSAKSENQDECAIEVRVI